MSHRRHYISSIFGRFDDSSPVLERSSAASLAEDETDFSSGHSRCGGGGGGGCMRRGCRVDGGHS